MGRKNRGNGNEQKTPALKGPFLKILYRNMQEEQFAEAHLVEARGMFLVVQFGGTPEKPEAESWIPYDSIRLALKADEAEVQNAE